MHLHATRQERPSHRPVALTGRDPRSARPPRSDDEQQIDITADQRLTLMLSQRPLSAANGHVRGHAIKQLELIDGGFDFFVPCIPKDAG